MPFALQNPGQTFQRMMDNIFRDLPFDFGYIDDHLLSSKNMDEHMDHLRQFFNTLSTNGRG